MSKLEGRISTVQGFLTRVSFAPGRSGSVIHEFPVFFVVAGELMREQSGNERRSQENGAERFEGAPGEVAAKTGERKSAREESRHAQYFGPDFHVPPQLNLARRLAISSVSIQQSAMRIIVPIFGLFLLFTSLPHASAAESHLTLAREGHWLIIRGEQAPEIRINYLEAYCRAGSTGADWMNHT